MTQGPTVLRKLDHPHARELCVPALLAGLAKPL